MRTVLVWLSTYIPYQLNIVSDYAITQYRTNASEIAHLVRIVCSGLYTFRARGDCMDAGCGLGIVGRQARNASAVRFADASVVVTCLRLN